CNGDAAQSFEDPRVGVFGNGVLNNGLIGNQTYLETPGTARADGHTGTWYAYQTEGSNGTLSPGAFYTNGEITIEFDLGASYDLTTVRIDYSTHPTIGFFAPLSVNISDGVNPDVVFSNFPAASDGNGFGV